MPGNVRRHSKRVIPPGSSNPTPNTHTHPARFDGGLYLGRLRRWSFGAARNNSRHHRLIGIGAPPECCWYLCGGCFWCVRVCSRGWCTNLGLHSRTHWHSHSHPIGLVCATLIYTIFFRGCWTQYARQRTWAEPHKLCRRDCFRYRWINLLTGRVCGR